MLRLWMSLSLIGIVLTAGLAAAQTAQPAPTQPTPATPSAPPSTTTTSGVFDKLSPGEQKIARALFEAQTTSTTTKPMTLDQIAMAKQNGKGWGEVFQQMKSQGLMTEKNLGDVVSKFEKQQTGSPEKGGKVDRPEKSGKPEKPESQKPESPGRGGGRGR